MGSNENRVRSIFTWVAAFTIILVHSILAYGIVNMILRDRTWIAIAKDHTAASIGIPLAGTASLFLVLILRFIGGDVEFKILNVNFKGANSQAVIWVFSYLAIILSIYLLWPLK